MIRTARTELCVGRYLRFQLSQAYKKVLGHRRNALVVFFLAGIGLVASACGTASSTSAKDSSIPPTHSAKMTEYVAGHWIPFTSTKPLSPTQWAVVDAYSNFSTAVLAVYTTHSVAPLATVVSSQSKVTTMFSQDLATGKNPEALYTQATVESVAIHGCRASLTLELFYPDGHSLHYVSSWVRPFDRAALAHTKRTATGQLTNHPSNLASLSATQYAPWQFVGDNRVGGVDTPCGI